MKTWLTSDPHFGHARVNELCDRPFSSVEEMNAGVLEGINSTVAAEDRLVILGDLCMGKLEDSLPILAEIRAAEIVLVPGNHDRWSLAYEHRGDADFKREEFRARYEDQSPKIRTLVDKRPSGWTWYDLTGESNRWLDTAWFSHFPYDGDSVSYGPDRHVGLRVPNDGVTPIVHGHVHQEWKTRKRQFNVGVDANDMKPVSSDEVAAWIESLPH